MIFVLPLGSRAVWDICWTTSVTPHWQFLKSLTSLAVPLVSYIRNSLRFCIMLPLVPVVKILKKIGVTKKIWETAGIKLLWDLTEKSVNFSTLATSNIRLLPVFGKEDRETKLVRFVKKNS